MDHLELNGDVVDIDELEARRCNQAGELYAQQAARLLGGILYPDLCIILPRLQGCHARDDTARNTVFRLQHVKSIPPRKGIRACQSGCVAAAPAR